MSNGDDPGGDTPISEYARGVLNRGRAALGLGVEDIGGRDQADAVEELGLSESDPRAREQRRASDVFRSGPESERGQHARMSDTIGGNPRSVLRGASPEEPREPLKEQRAEYEQIYGEVTNSGVERALGHYKIELYYTTGYGMDRKITLGGDDSPAYIHGLYAEELIDYLEAEVASLRQIVRARVKMAKHFQDTGKLEMPPEPEPTPTIIRRVIPDESS